MKGLTFSISLYATTYTHINFEHGPQTGEQYTVGPYSEYTLFCHTKFCHFCKERERRKKEKEKLKSNTENYADYASSELTYSTEHKL